MTDGLLIFIAFEVACLGLHLSYITYNKENLMSELTDAIATLTPAINALAASVDAYVAFTDDLFAKLQAALANQTPAEALAAVQAAVATATSEKAKIDADIAKNQPPAVG